ncbi:MAG: restriction endonuclease subunit S [Actinomycetota bacterium]|nr:restriction endonuclease subunit S [Actinomycetota bacterium]
MAHIARAELPEHWSSVPVRYLAEINNRTLPENTPLDTKLRYFDIGSVGSDGSLQEPMELLFRDAPSRARRLVQAGDTAVSTVRTYLRAITYVDRSKSDAVWSTGFAILTPGQAIHPRFLYYAVRSEQFVAEIQARSVGVSYPAVNAADLASIPCPVPPVDEQSRIVDFLDDEFNMLASSERRLGRLRRLIGERAAAASSFRLHCGRLLGLSSDLPADWRLVRLKFLAHLQSGVTLGRTYPGSDLVKHPYLRVANVQDGRLDLADVSTIAVPEPDVSQYQLQPGDVLMTEGGDNDKLGRGTVWNGEIPECLHQNHVFAVRPDRTKLRPEFLAAVMASTHGKAYFQSTAHQTTNLASTNSAKLMNFPIPLPPVHAQDRLLQQLHEGRDTAVRLDAVLRDQLKLLAERRQALITATVTGQLDPSSYRGSAVAA